MLSVVDDPPCVIVSGTSNPEGIPLKGTDTLIWYTPMLPASSPANVTRKGTPPRVTLTGTIGVACGSPGAGTPASTEGDVLPRPVRMMVRSSCPRTGFETVTRSPDGTRYTLGIPVSVPAVPVRKTLGAV